MDADQTYARIERHYRANYRILVGRYNRYLGSIHRAEDVVQQGYLNALTYWKTAPEPDNELHMWLTTICNHTMRKNKQEEAMHGAIGTADGTEPTSEKPSLIPIVIQADVLRRMDEEPEKARKILQLFFVSQYIPKEIAALIDETPNAIRQTVWRFRQKVRADLKWSI